MGLFSKQVPVAPAPPVAAPSGDRAESAPAAAGAAKAGATPPRANIPVPVAAPVPAQSERQVYLQQMKLRIHQQLVERLDMQNLKSLPPEVVRGEVRILIRELCQSEKGLINSADQ